MSGTLLCGLALVSKAVVFFLKTVFKCRINLSDVQKTTAHPIAEVYVNHGSGWNVNTPSVDLLFKTLDVWRAIVLRKNNYRQSKTMMQLN